MKPTTQQTRAQKPMPTRILIATELTQVTGGDVYLHNPRGSNNRLDETG